MKQTKRAAALFCAAALLTLLLCACGSGTKTVPVTDVAAAVGEAIGKADAMTESDALFLGYTRLTGEQLGEHTVLINAYGANVDEYGVFRAGTMSAQELKAAVDGYLETRRAAWMDAYMPEEKPKMTGAESRVSGDYVLYCILSDADKDAAFAAFEASVK